MTMFIKSDGSTTTCQDRTDSSFFACTVTITNPATGAFTYKDLTSADFASGTFNFLTGSTSGTHNTTGTFAGQRR